MTPFSETNYRTATIRLSPIEERVARAMDPAAPGASPWITSILAKLRHSLEVGDILLAPAPGSPERPFAQRTPRPSVGAKLSLKDLGL